MVKTSLGEGILLAMKCLYCIFALCINADTTFYTGACLEDSGFIVALIGSGPPSLSLIIMVWLLSANSFLYWIDDLCFFIVLYAELLIAFGCVIDT